MRLNHINQWQTARMVSYNDDTSFLSNYDPGDLTDTVKAKMASIAPATAIILRALGRFGVPQPTVLISGWMNPNSPKTAGPGHRLYRLDLENGLHTTTVVPLTDGKWAGAGFMEVDDYWYSPGFNFYDMVGVTRLDEDKSNGVSGQEACILLPTLGYTHLLFETTGLSGAEGGSKMGFLYRPILLRELKLTF